jgi:hypothetical protein
VLHTQAGRAFWQIQVVTSRVLQRFSQSSHLSNTCVIMSLSVWDFNQSLPGSSADLDSAELLSFNAKRIRSWFLSIAILPVAK